MPGIRALLSALAAAACAVALAACGGDDEDGPIPAEQGNQLLEQLDEIETAVRDGNCDEAQRAAVIFAQNVSLLELPDDRELREALVEAGRNLEALTEDPDQCEPDIGPSGTTGVVPTETTQTTETTTTTTTPEEPADEGDEGNGQSNPPQDGGNGQGGGNGNGAGGDDSSGGIGSDG